MADREQDGDQIQAVRKIEGALRLSSHVLSHDKNQLASQLLGRLQGDDNGDVQQLLTGPRRWKRTAWLRPLTPTLIPPGGSLLRILSGHSDGVNAVAVTPDGKLAISASIDSTLKVWELSSGRELRTLSDHSGRLNAVAVTPDGKLAISASGDRMLNVWELSSGRRLAGFTADALLFCCAVDRNAKTVVAGDQSGQVHFLRLEGLTKTAP